MNPHEHDWRRDSVDYVSGGDKFVRQIEQLICLHCGATRQVTRKQGTGEVVGDVITESEPLRLSTGSSYPGIRWVNTEDDDLPFEKDVLDRMKKERVREEVKKKRAVNRAKFEALQVVNGGGVTEFLKDYGGLSSYNRSAGLIQTGDGSKLKIADIIWQNPGLTGSRLETLIYSELSRQSEERAAAASQIAQGDLEPWEVELLKASTPMQSPNEIRHRVIMEQLPGLVEAWQLGNISGEVAVNGFRKLLGITEPPVKPEDALIIIVDSVKASADPFITGGKWMVNMTTAISEAIKEAEKPDADES